MTEKNIDNEKREKDLKYFLVVLLLLVICCLEFIHLYKLNKITHKHHWMNKIENMFDRDFRHKKPMDTKSMQQNTNKIREDLKNKMQQAQNSQMVSSETKQQYEQTYQGRRIQTSTQPRADRTGNKANQRFFSSQSVYCTSPAPSHRAPLRALRHGSQR